MDGPADAQVTAPPSTSPTPSTSPEPPGPCTNPPPVVGFASVTAWGCGPNNITRTGSFTSPPYAYTLEPAGTVAATVTAGAGTGHI
jgi:hypothetical protein